MYVENLLRLMFEKEFEEMAYTAADKNGASTTEVNLKYVEWLEKKLSKCRDGQTGLVTVHGSKKDKI